MGLHVVFRNGEVSGDALVRIASGDMNQDLELSGRQHDVGHENREGMACAATDEVTMRAGEDGSESPSEDDRAGIGRVENR